MVAYERLRKASLSCNKCKKSSWDKAGANLGVFWAVLLAFAAWTNNLILGLDLEAKGTGGGAFWSWVGLVVVVAATTGFKAELAVAVLGTGEALETSKILLLEGEKTLWPFSCSFY